MKLVYSRLHILSFYKFKIHEFRRKKTQHLFRLFDLLISLMTLHYCSNQNHYRVKMTIIHEGLFRSTV